MADAATDATLQPAFRGRLIPLSKWNQHHAWPPLGGLRHLWFHRDTNGFRSCARKVGKTILIAEDAFLAWVAKCDAEG